MNVPLTPDLEQLLDDRVESGLYQTPGEVVREALRLLEARDRAQERLRADVKAGFDELARGHGRELCGASGRRLARAETRGRVIAREAGL
jgi:antitoxin ParD1/3/4